MRERVTPRLLVGIGLLLFAVTVLDGVYTAVSPSRFGIARIGNMLTTLPFVIVLVGGGYWLSRGGLGADHHSRIAGWTVGGLAFMGGFFALTALVSQYGLQTRLEIVRWGVATGAGGGALVGILEGRAVERALVVERTQIRNEELRRQNERLDEFTSLVAHDLRNPLEVAMAGVELARDDADSEHLDTIADALDRMDTQIDHFLMVARSGQAVDDATVVSLDRIAEQSWLTVENRNGTLTVEQMPTVLADPDRVKHVFENLYRNAIEHAGDDVTIRVGRTEDGFFVEDDGPGIPAEDRETVLDRGYSTTKNGTGFGLAIVRDIVEAHGWDLTITDGTAGGARFEITNVDVVTATDDDGPNSGEDGAH